MGPGDLFEEREEFLVAVAEFARPGHGAGRDVQRREQCRGPVPLMVKGSALGQSELHGQHRRGAVQRLDLGLLIHA